MVVEVRRRYATMVLVLVGLACSGPARPAAQPAPGTAGPAARPTSGDASTIVARIGDQVVTAEEVDRLALTRDAGQFRGMRLRDALYESRRTALDSIVADRLIALEAARERQPAAAILERALKANMTPVTDADVQAWYTANQGRLNGAPLASLSARIREGLEQERRDEAREKFVERLKARTPVSVLLPVPRESIDVASDEPSKGPAAAPIQIVMYSDYQCPYCASVEPTLAKVTEVYGNRVRIVFRDFPLTAIHPRAVAAATAAQCAHEQGRFWDYHARLFANQSQMSDDVLLKHATDLGLDVKAFSTCTTGERAASSVAADTASGEALGVSATPAFFVNGRFLSGARPYQHFERLIEEELKSAAAR
jgi:protein-disulfide isomerase